MHVSEYSYGINEITGAFSCYAIFSPREFIRVVFCSSPHEYSQMRRIGVKAKELPLPSLNYSINLE